MKEREKSFAFLLVLQQKNPEQEEEEKEEGQWNARKKKIYECDHFDWLPEYTVQRNYDKAREL